MSNNHDNIGISETNYNKLYSSDIVSCMNSITRSYSSGIDAPTVSSNRLRVYSTDYRCPGPLRVRSSPSSPNRLSKFQCKTLVRKKWPAVNKMNQSSSSEFGSYPTSSNSNRSLQCDFKTEQLDLSWKQDSSQYFLTARPTSCQSLQSTWSSIPNKDVPCSLSKDLLTVIPRSSTANIKKQSENTDDEHYNYKRIEYGSQGEHEKIESEISTPPFHNKSLIFANKTLSYPTNFKKVLRDRYLNSQQSSNLDFFNSSSSSSYRHIYESRSLTDDCLFYHTNSTSSVFEDNNFKLIQKPSIDVENSLTSTMNNVGSKKSLSIDIRNLSALKKYRIQSNNSTISSMSGIEAEGDPFSPASTEICSPFLKLNFPYQANSKNMSVCNTPTLLSSSSLGALTLAHETSDSSCCQTSKPKSAQRFFPETMILSDFHTCPPYKSDCHLYSNITERLTLPTVLDRGIGSKSAPQSLQLSPNGTNLLSGSKIPISCPTTTSDKLYSKEVTLKSEEDVYFVRSMPSSKSMDYLDSWCIKFDKPNCEIFKKLSDNLIKKQAVHQISKKQTSSTSTSSRRQCSICGRLFNRSDMLARHSRVHTGHKPFECSICTQSFSRSDHLNTHMRIHSGEKPYRCSLCSYSACRRDMITRHLKVHRRKGDSSMDSISVLVINKEKVPVHQQKKSAKTKSQNSLNINLENMSDERDILTLHRSQSFSENNESYNFTDQNPPPLSHPNEKTNRFIPKTFANISISICQPTPRSSFSMPMESQNDS